MSMPAGGHWLVRPRAVNQAHPLQPVDVHRHEGEVRADEPQPEVDLPEPLVEEATGPLRPPEVEPAQAG
jgi:hypothetical protein